MKNKKVNKAIGVFDSGFGGLATLKEIVKRLPEYNYVYLGDTARVPYGNRSMEVVYQFTKQAVDFLFANDCQLILIACNTASADALRKIQRNYLPVKYKMGERVIGVIVPAVEEAVLKTRNHRVGLIATEGTVHSKTFEHELLKLNPKIKLFSKACPLLVPLVESGEHTSKAGHLILKNYLTPLVEKNIDTLILGCTHYGILEPTIRKIVGKHITIISDAAVVPQKLGEYLHRHPEINSLLTKNSKLTFYSTDFTDRFQKLGTQFFGQTIFPIKVTLD